MDFKITVLTLATLALMAVGCASSSHSRHDRYNRHGHHNRHGNYYTHSHSNSYDYRHDRYYQEETGLEGIDSRDWGKRIVLTPSMDDIWDTYDPKPMYRRKDKRHSHRHDNEYAEKERYEDEKPSQSVYKPSTAASREAEVARHYGFKNVEEWKKSKKRKAPWKTERPTASFANSGKEIVIIPVAGPPKFLTLAKAKRMYDDSLSSYRKDTLSPYLSIYTHRKIQRTRRTADKRSVRIIRKGNREHVLIEGKSKLVADKVYWVGKGRDERLCYLARSGEELVFGVLGSRMKVRYQP